MSEEQNKPEEKRVLREDETILIQEGSDPDTVVNHRKRMQEQEGERAEKNPSEETAESRPFQENVGQNKLPPVTDGNVAGSAPANQRGESADGNSPEEKRDEEQQ